MKIGYARVSTGNQDTALQMDALEAAGCERIYQEAFSGKSRQRVELTRVLEMLRAGDTLIVWRLDRLGRSLKDLVEIMSELEQRQVGFKSLTESVDTTTAGGKLVFHLFGALAEFERSLIQERTKAGLEAARARGRRGGRPQKLNVTQIRMARAMLLDEQTTKAQVAKHFGVSRPTLNKALSGLNG